MTLSTDMQQKLQRQVEFYFSDVNIGKDVFLKKTMAENVEGFVPLETLLKFNRVNAITTDVQKLSAALQPSEKLVLSGDGLMVRRKDPLPDSIQTDDRTVYVKPLPATATLEQLTAFFNQYGSVEAVWRRYFPGKKDEAPESRVKPSVFVVFASKDEAEAFASAPPKYDEVQLTADMKLVYLENKNKDRKRQDKTSSSGATTTTTTTTTTARKTPSMPLDSSYRITECGTIESFSSVKELWPSEEQSGVRYVSVLDKETALLVFQDAATGEKMVTDLKQRGTTLNGKQPVVVKVEGAQEKAMLAHVESEIAERAKKNANVRSGARGKRASKRSRE